MGRVVSVVLAVSCLTALWAVGWNARGRWNRCFLACPACNAAETNSVVQVKYTITKTVWSRVATHTPRVAVPLWPCGRDSMLLVQEHKGSWGCDQLPDTNRGMLGALSVPGGTKSLTANRQCTNNSLSLSGSNQARKGRLVNALAVRGDERRDTLR